MKLSRNRIGLVLSFLMLFSVSVIFVFYKNIIDKPKSSQDSVLKLTPVRDREIPQSGANTSHDLNVNTVSKNGVDYLLSDVDKSSIIIDNVIYLEKNNKIYKRKFSGFAKASWFGAKGDGINDDTQALQKLIESSVDSIQLDGKRYLVSKNTNLKGFPMNDEPCLLIRNRNRLVFDGNNAVINVKEHGQGILEVQQSSDVKLENIHVQGAGNFPRLDGETGRGEKGVDKQGYHTTPFWGLYKNNSYKTDAKSGGGFGKAFPQFDGGTKGSWGKWNGGYIGNVAFGILIFNGSRNITILNCKAEHFNYVGIGVGHNGEYKGMFTPKQSLNIRLLNNTASNNYEAGFHTMDVDKVLLENCSGISNGHPNSKPSDEFSDPGYGYTARGSSKYTKNAIVRNSRFNNNKRKGLDIHAGIGITFEANVVENNAVGGIYAAKTSKSQIVANINIVNNKLINNSFARAGLGAIYIGSNASLKAVKNDLNSKVLNNVIEGYDKFGINVRLGNNIEVRGNKILGGNSRFGVNPFAISIEGNGENRSLNVKVSDNIIENSKNSNFKAFRIISVEGASILNNSINSINEGSKLIESTNIKTLNFDKNQSIKNSKRSSLLMPKTN